MCPQPTNLVLLCSACRLPQASLKLNLKCGICQAILCKDCTQFLGEEAFSFLKKIPEELKHATYCGNCFDEKVRPAQEAYLKTMARAKNVYIFEKSEKYIPLINKSKNKLIITDCADRKDTLLRLAFLAAQDNFNAVINVEITYKKIRINNYQTTAWSGMGFPAQIRSSRLEADIS